MAFFCDGTALTFQAERVDEPAGLYRYIETIDGVETINGWIVLANNELRGGRRIGTQLTAATSLPIGWLNANTDPVEWTDPSPQPIR